MKKMILTGMVAAMAVGGAQSVRADGGWATAGKILTGVAIGATLTSVCQPCPAPVYVAPGPVYVAPPVTYVAPPAAYVAPPVVVQPAPVYVAPPVVYVRPAPVVYAYPPAVVVRYPYGYHYRGHGHYYH